MLAAPLSGIITDVPVGDFPSDSVEVPILANETIGLDDPSAVNWRTPIGWSGQERLEYIIVYSDEGHAIKYGVDDRAVSGGRGLEIVSSSNHMIPEGVDIMLPLGFMGDMFIAHAGDVLHEIDFDDMESEYQLELGYEPIWWSNLWNRWNPLNNRGELLYTMADETTLGLYAKIPPWPELGHLQEKSYYDTVTMDDYNETSGSEIIGEPIVLNIPLVENGSLVVVPTNHGIAALSLDIPVVNGYPVNVTIGDMAWYIGYDDIGDQSDQEVVPIQQRPISVASEFPNEAYGKERIYLITEAGILHSVFRANGSLDWSSDLMEEIFYEFQMVGVFPFHLGHLVVIANIGDEGLIVAVDPETGRIAGNGTYHHVIPNLLLMEPDYVYSIRSYIFNDDKGTVYILTDKLGLHAQFKVPGGLASPVGYAGNIVNKIGSSQGNYFATVTGNATLWVQSMTGYYYPPPLPPVDVDGWTAVIVTDMGNITIGFLSPYVHSTVIHFFDIVGSGFYNNTSIDYIETSITVTSGANGEPFFLTPNEGRALALSNHYGAVSMVTHGPSKTGPELNIVVFEGGYQQFDGDYAVFGVVLEGMHVAKAISEVPHDEHYRPIDPIFIREIVLVGPRDTVPPVVRPGENQTVFEGEMFKLNGSTSSDNVGIINWTWSFIYEGEEKLLYGPVVEFTFDIVGNYTVDLTVKDEEGNSATGNMTVFVLKDTEDDGPEDEGWTTGEIYGITALSLIIVAVIFLVLLFKKAKKEEEP